MPQVNHFNFSGHPDRNYCLRVLANTDSNVGATGAYARPAFHLRCVHSLFRRDALKICAARAPFTMACTVCSTCFHNVLCPTPGISFELPHRMARPNSSQWVGKSVRL